MHASGVPQCTGGDWCTNGADDECEAGYPGLAHTRSGTYARTHGKTGRRPVLLMCVCPKCSGEQLLFEFGEGGATSRAEAGMRLQQKPRQRPRGCRSVSHVSCVLRAQQQQSSGYVADCSGSYRGSGAGGTLRCCSGRSGRGGAAMTTTATGGAQQKNPGGTRLPLQAVSSANSAGPRRQFQRALRVWVDSRVDNGAAQVAVVEH